MPIKYAQMFVGQQQTLLNALNQIAIQFATFGQLIIVAAQM